MAYFEHQRWAKFLITWPIQSSYRANLPESFWKEFDFHSFNKQLINQVVSGERIIAFDPSYIPKVGKSTYGRGKYWSGVACAAKWDLDICGFAMVDIVNNTALHLKAWQTISADELDEKGLNLLFHYASLVTENAEKFKFFSKYCYYKDSNI